MKRTRLSAVVTACTVAAVLAAGGVAVALAPAGEGTPAGTEQQLPSVSSTVPPPASTNAVPSSTVPSMATPPIPLVAPAQGQAGENGGMTEPAPQPAPEPEPIPTDSAGNPLNPTNALTPPSPPPPPNGQPEPSEAPETP